MTPRRCAPSCSTPAGQPFESIENTLDRDHTETVDDAFLDIYRKLRPGEPPTVESARGLLENLFFNPKRYDLAKVGRHKVNKKLKEEFDALEPVLERIGLERPTDTDLTLTRADILATVSYLVKLHAREADHWDDDIDHFGNRRIRSVGELIQNQVRIGLSRMERVVRERMTTQDVEAITPQTLINIRPGRGRHQGVLRVLPAVAVHGPDEPAGRPDPQAAPLGPRPRRSLPGAGRVRGP